jgi:hypothetical protein
VLRSPRYLQIVCNHEGLAHFGGTWFLHELIRVLQFRDFLARHLTYPRRNNDYSLSQMLLALIYPIILGLDRMETTSLLSSYGAFQHVTGLPGFAAPLR